MEAAMTATTGGMPFAQAGALGSAGGKGIRAYHGSPHDFDRFDLSKIGTGEGAQAYGHGLYFAENEKVAREYRDVLTRRPVNDSEITATVTGNALFDIAEKNGDLISGKIPFGPSRSLLTREQIVSGFEQGKFSPHDLPPAIQRQIVDHIKPPGRMYEVNINAHPDQFLDWDKPLSGQGEAVRQALPQISIPGVPLAQRLEGGRLAPRGDEIYRTIQESMPGLGGKASATGALREAGIPGIKYLDQGSRPIETHALQIQKEAAALARSQGNIESAEALEAVIRSQERPTSNYVVFDDKLIDILKKYGIAGPLGALMAQGNETQQ
jgi:hypothetical protein